MTPARENSPGSDRLTRGLFAAIVLLGFGVLASWHFHPAAGARMSAGMPMPYLTALGFVALGVAGLGLSPRRPRWLLVGGGLAAIIGVTVLLGYATDRLDGDTGRMTLTAAFSFALAGGSLALLAGRPQAYAILGIVNSVTLSLALTSLIGYAFQITYVLPFSLGAQMAPHTAAAFLGAGIALLGYSWKYADCGPDGMPKWCAGIGVGLLPVLLLGASALFPEQSWQVVLMEVLGAGVAVAVMAFSLRWLTTARVAHKGMLMIAQPLVLLLIFVGLVLHVKRQGKAAQELARHSTEVIAGSHAFLEQLTETESAVRAYLITRDEALGGSFDASLVGITETVARLHGLVADNPGQQAGIERIAQLSAQRVDHLAGAVKIIRQGDAFQIEELRRDRKGIEWMRLIRAHMTAFLREEGRIEAERRLALDVSWQRLSWLLVAGTTAAILLASILTLSFSGGISRRLRRLRDNSINLAAGRALAPPLAGDDEIADLDRVFHEMSDSLAAAARREQERRVVESRIVDVRHSEALLQAGALQNAIYNSANFSSIATDAHGVIQIFNIGAERMLGYAAADVINKITPADISDPQEVVARAATLSVELATAISPGFEALVFKASRGIEDIYELTYIRKDGSRFPAVVSVTALRDPQGAIIGYLLIGTDNTARKEAEAALLKEGALQSAIFNSANFSSIATDEKGVIQIFNVGAERMLGYAAADVTNKITPADISDPQEVIARAQALSLELGVPITPGFEALVFKASRGIEDIYELTYIRKDGSRFPAIVSVTALRAIDGGIIGYLLIGTDNTARKQVEAEQRKLDQRLRDLQFYTRSLIEANSDALMTTDPHGLITDVNRQMEALTGCTRDELIGAPFKRHFTDPARAEAAITRVLSEQKVTDYELTARARDGRETVVSYNATTFHDREQRLQGVFAAARDITELKRSEQALQESNIELECAKSTAEKANLAKSDFLSSMSHELRSPLNAILGFAQLMDTATPEPTPAQSARIAQILSAGWHLLNLINEILDLAVIESGKVSVSLEPVSLAEVMAECRTMMEPQAEQHGITMTFPSPVGLGLVLADHTRLKQIVINLLSNAIKYNRPHGTVLVACAPAAAGRTRLSVRDTGAGLGPEKIAQLFQPFNRLGQEAGGVAGTGIGLVVTKQLAELMQGAIGVESHPGVGSVFWIELNSVTASILPVEETAAPFSFNELSAEPLRVRTLLYIEDNPANLLLVEQLIARRADLKLFTAVNASLGLALARTVRPEVILMDLNLPGISGPEALKILRADPATTRIPVVALSANAMLRDIEQGLAAGFFRYLTKPIKMKEFNATVADALALADANSSALPPP